MYFVVKYLDPMRWEDQELNHETPENKFPEVLFAGLSLLGHASEHQRQYLRIDQKKLETMVAEGALNERAKGARIDRLCLHFRLFCSLGPGGDHTQHWVSRIFGKIQSVFTQFFTFLKITTGWKLWLFQRQRQHL